ncbi:MAG: PepSY domain-containing protein [Alphaproteobacteria bacterium]
MRWLIPILVALAIALEPPPVQAQARSGEARPLGEILSGVSGRYPGRLLNAELVDRRGGLFYEIRLLQPDGAITELTVDARTGRVVRARSGRRR